MANKNPVTMWKKGEPSPNPAGRPKSGTALSDILRERVDAAKLADALLNVAYAGDVPAIKATLDRLEGRPRETVEVSGHIDNSAKIAEIQEMLKNANPIESAD
jgi:formylmethanofuran dehydrogenase subunit B